MEKTIYVVITSCPERYHLINPLIQSLDYPYIEVLEDTQHKGVWEISKRAWQISMHVNCDYFMVMQEDLKVCKDFIPSIIRLCSMEPILFTPFNRLYNTTKIKDTWRICEFINTGLVQVMQIDHARRWTWWAENTFKPEFHSYDQRLYHYAYTHKLNPRIIIPGLADHMWELPSAMGHRGNPIKADQFISQNVSGLELDLESGFYIKLPKKFWIMIPNYERYLK